MKWPDVIFLNGTSSSGKTTLAKALQAKLNHPYLHFGFDDLIMMMPERYWKDAAAPREKGNNPWLKEGVEIIETQRDGDPKCTVFKIGPVLQPVICAMSLVVATIAKSGTAVIFDHVIHDQSMYEDCERDFSELSVVKIGVTCPIEVLEKREIERGDRILGLARGLHGVVHRFCDYDVTIDTSNETVEQSVLKIENYLKHSG